MFGIALFATVAVGWVGFDSPLVFVYLALEVIFSIAYSCYLYSNAATKDRRKAPFIFLAILNLFYFSLLLPMFFDEGKESSYLTQASFLLPILLLLMFHFGLKWNKDRSLDLFFPFYILTFVYLIVQILEGFSVVYS